MKVYLKNKSEVSLGQTDFIASGGEGSIYKKNGSAFKLYADPSKMIPEGKINELSVLNAPVVAPREAIFDKSGKPIGYTMDLVPPSVPLCKLFTASFKDSSGVTRDTVLSLVNSFRKSVSDVHGKNVLIVDCNELNFLVGDSFDKIFFIDVDSYQTEHFPATALMDSVKDWHANGKWTTGSDWFSWGILAFQMITGIHPYKGKHLSVNSLADRMKSNISVFNKEVRVPKIIPDFGVIPDTLRGWFRAVFEEMKRDCPPDFVNGKYVLVAGKGSTVVSVKFDIVEVDLFNSEITDVVSMEDYRVFLTKNGSFKNSKIPCDKPVVQNGFIYKGNRYEISGDRLVLRQLIGMNKIQTDSVVANVMPNSSIAFDGVVIQNMLGTYFATICPKKNESYTVRINELPTGAKVVDAKFESGVLMVLANVSGRYDKFVIRFEEGFGKYACWTTMGVDYYSLNFSVLDTGVCAEIDENENMVLFAAKPIGDKKVISDKDIGHDMRLFADKNTLMFCKGNKTFSIKMKK